MINIPLSLILLYRFQEGVPSLQIADLQFGVGNILRSLRGQLLSVSSVLLDGEAGGFAPRARLLSLVRLDRVKVNSSGTMRLVGSGLVDVVLEGSVIARGCSAVGGFEKVIFILHLDY